ncbi:hypothetical protein AVBRAN12642_07180 [Campylobacter sp. RM12642]|uniref:hypothetical protein n=1 Tax=unclassified Campylobacter TaxID=2593542 RepID=UPI001D9E5804|nr:hypothetical protein [Campylobacter sp. RM12642]MBZ8008443.1 hypothetical protein [Campylobacter sp. RM9334]
MKHIYKYNQGFLKAFGYKVLKYGDEMLQVSDKRFIYTAKRNEIAIKGKTTRAKEYLERNFVKIYYRFNAFLELNNLDNKKVYPQTLQALLMAI